MLLALFLYQTILPANTDDPVVIERLQGEIVFDGMPDEAAWRACEPFPMVTHNPVFGKEPQEKTDIRILYDNDFIYIGAALYTKDPSTIQATSKKRDELKGDSDWIGIIFDSYNDNENGLAFWTTPTGLRTDISIYNDATGEQIPPIPVHLRMALSES